MNLRAAVEVAVLLVAGCSGSTRAHDLRGARDVTAQTIARDYFEKFWNRSDPHYAERFIAPDVVGHVGAGRVTGRDRLLARREHIARVYSENRFSIDDLVGQGDRVVVRWTQVARHTGALYGPSTAGRSVRVTGIHVFRMAENRIAEIWVQADDLGELQQLGISVPDPV